MEGSQGEGNTLANEVHGGADSLLPHAPDRLELRPAASDIDGAKGGEEEALRALAAMKDKVRLDRAGWDTLPLTPGPDGHLALQGCRGGPLPLGLPEAAGSVLAQQSVDTGRADLEEKRPHVRGDLQLAVPPPEAGRRSGMTEARSLPHIRSPTSHNRTRLSTTAGP